MQADKVYLPLIRPNTDNKDGNKQSSMFGLNEVKMEAFSKGQIDAPGMLNRLFPPLRLIPSKKPVKFSTQLPTGIMTT